MDFKDYLEVNAQRVNQELDEILSEFLNETDRISIKLLPFARAFLNSCKEGKRIRGVLVKLGYEIANESTDYRLQSTAEVGSRKTVDILRIAAALEILHSAILIHDDVIDQSPTRRGQPSLYKALRPKDGRVGGDHYGISQAISLGDIGLYLPIQIIADSNFSDEFKNKALSYLSKTIVTTGWGEVLDVDMARQAGKAKEEDIILLYKLKTAKYTISAPLILGAILAGADEKLISKLGEFGEAAGIAFQIQDDILDITSDIEEGKNTLLVTQAFKKADPKGLRVLEQYYGKGYSEDQGQEVRKVFLETGSLDYSSKIALQYASKAKKVIPKIAKDIQMIKLLEEMIGYLVQRTK